MVETDLDISNSDILDKVKDAFWFRTDREVAGFLGVSQKTVSSIRNGKQSLSARQRIKIMDRLMTVKVQNLLIKISPEDLGKEIYRLGLMGEERLALHETGNGKATLDDNVLIELFRSYGQRGGSFATDEDMAVFLGVSCSMISAVRHGKTELGPLPRLKMLKAINPETDIDQVLNGLESNQFLHDLIEKHTAMMAIKTNQRKAVTISP